MIKLVRVEKGISIDAGFIGPPPPPQQTPHCPKCSLEASNGGNAAPDLIGVPRHVVDGWYRLKYTERLG